jgi:hypothetical protein
MNVFFRIGMPLMAVVLCHCVETTPVPGGTGWVPPPPPKVLMPVDLSARERAYVPQVEDVLRRSGLDPVYRGSADLLLEFSIEEGPINVDTNLRLIDDDRVEALGQGRASGPPLINRNGILEASFYQALRGFEGELSRRRPAYPSY